MTSADMVRSVKELKEAQGEVWRVDYVGVEAGFHEGARSQVPTSSLKEESVWEVDRC